MTYDSINDIKQVFFEYQNPKWLLVDGKGPQKYPSSSSGRLYYQSEDIDLNSSWNILEAKFNLFKSRGGGATLYLGEGNSDMIRIPISLPPIIEQSNNTSIAGLIPSGYMTREQLADKMEIYELKRQVEDIQNSQIGGIWERIGERVLQDENLIPAITNIVGVLMQRINPGVTGQHINPAPEIAGERLPDVNPDELGSNFVRSIRGAFSSDEELTEVLSNVSELMRKNPVQMKKIIQTIKENQG